MTTQDILDVLVSERKYQKRRWGFRQPDGSFEESKRTVGEYMVYMQDYLTEAFHERPVRKATIPLLTFSARWLPLAFAASRSMAFPAVICCCQSSTRGMDWKHEQANLSRHGWRDR